jgi:hypothetical protein
MCAGMIGHQLNGLLKTRQALGLFPLFHQRNSQVVMRIDMPRLKTKHLAQEILRAVMFFHIQSDHAKKMQGADVVRFVLEDLPTQNLGLLKIASPVMLQCQLECLRQGVHV